MPDPRPPLVLLHGFLGRGADWDPFRDALARAAAERGVALGDVRAPDLPGHGAAMGLPPERYTVAGACRALADGLGAPADVVGYSMGGRVALALALRHPGRVRRLVLLSASPGLEAETDRAARRRLDADRAAEIVSDLDAFVRRWGRMPLFASLPARAVRERERVQRAQDPAELARSLAGMGTGAQASYWDRLGALPPTLAVAGRLDDKFTAIARRMAARAPDRVRAAIVDGAGHAPHLEAAEATARLVADALA